MTSMRGDTFLTRIIRTFAAASVEDIVVVVGQTRTRSSRRCRKSTCRSASSRIRTTNTASCRRSSRPARRRSPGRRAALVTLVDVPLVSEATVRAVLERYRDAGACRPLVRGADHGIRCSSIGRCLTRSAKPNRRWAPVIRANVSAKGDVDVDDPGAFADFDTPEDLATLKGSPYKIVPRKTTRPTEK
jgi:CTP:molybdopterin cytidylyltransferase MocA